MCSAHTTTRSERDLIFSFCAILLDERMKRDAKKDNRLKTKIERKRKKEIKNGKSISKILILYYRLPSTIHVDKMFQLFRTVEAAYVYPLDAK